MHPLRFGTYLTTNFAHLLCIAEAPHGVLLPSIFVLYLSVMACAWYESRLSTRLPGFDSNFSNNQRVCVPIDKAACFPNLELSIIEMYSRQHYVCWRQRTDGEIQGLLHRS